MGGASNVGPKKRIYIYIYIEFPLGPPGVIKFPLGPPGVKKKITLGAHGPQGKKFNLS